MNTAMQMAFKDITQSLPKPTKNETWYARPCHLLNKQTRQLNALLKVNKINY